ncbi:fimbrial protein [Acidovorax cavernicola]|nr:fimbrial protein [Acidovorax cavernicola]
MKKTLLFSTVVATFGLLALTPAQASDGQIEFEGSIVASSCTINGDAPNFKIDLPAIASKTLASATQTAGRVPVPIKLTNCSPEAGKVRVRFESGVTTNAAGRLVVDGGGAQNVELQLLNSEFDVVKAGFAEGDQNTLLVDTEGGSADLIYYVEYYATDAVSPGAVKSRVQYSIVYE